MQSLKLRRFLIVPLALVAVLALPMVALAESDSDSGSRTHQFGPFASTSPDGGTCGAPWANDTFNRVFKVSENGNGTFTVREDFKDGEFVTTGPVSPGACETDSRHGHTVLPGIQGEFGGYLTGTVTGGSFNPNGCAAPAACDSTAGFIAAVFGPTAVYSCTGGPGVCRFAFHYSAGGQDLIYHHWIDASDRNGVEFFKGDIANA